MKIFVTRRIPEEGLELLRRHLEVEVNPEDRILEKHEIIEALKDKEGLIIMFPLSLSIKNFIDKELFFTLVRVLASSLRPNE